MATIKLSTVLVHSGHSYTFHLHSDVTVSEVAQHISRYEPHLTINTLEIAHPIQPDQRLQDVDVQPGDRLIAFLQPVRQVELPTPLKPGDKILKFSLGDLEIDSRRKKGLLVGKSDPSQEIMPDIDLRYFLAPEALEFISRGCLWLSFDESNRVWYASKMGQTRITIDDFELGVEKISLNDSQRLRFYPPVDHLQPSHTDPLGTIKITVEEVLAHAPVETFRQGHHRLDVYVGAEGDGQTLRASETLPIEQIVAHLAQYNNTPLPQEARLYSTRLLSPENKMDDLHLGHDEFLYASLNPRYGRNRLHLTDIHDRERIYVLSAIITDEEKIIGCRAQADTPEPALQVDLYDALLNQGVAPNEAVAHQQGVISYKASENTWWIRPTPQAQTPLFVNNNRVGGGAATQLTSGDVISIGPSVHQFYIRLEVEIKSKTS
jgi:hypothetical protein